MTNHPIIRLVIATREGKDGFFTNTLTGKSLALYHWPFVQLRLFLENKAGLSTVYNQAIEEAKNDSALLVFLHDDILMCDFHWADQLIAGLSQFQIIGLAGNTRRVPKQPAWAFINDQFTWDDRCYLSGMVGHGVTFPPNNLSYFGPAKQEVKLLDGLLLASHSGTLINHHIRFDEQFAFHFYDMDFCRQAETKGLTLGTWPLSVVHKSGGNFGSEAWKKAYQAYLAKWME